MVVAAWPCLRSSERWFLVTFLSAAQLTTITKPWLCFGGGVAASVLAAAAAYFTNLGIAGSSSRKERSYVEPFLRPTPASIRSVRLGEVFRWAGIISVAVCIGCFIWGLASAEIALRNLTPAKPVPAFTK